MSFENQNQLAAESSPYLRLHADNPVNWQTWNPQALDHARQSDKPIILSIGYSTCHWCHVMARESFSDPATAAVMNEHFVSIKVDREERPDLDKIYQTALQLLNRQGGGWPLTMFLDPQTLLPFYGGTYFPNQPRYQLPSFQDLLRRIHEAFSNSRDDIGEQAQQLQNTLAQMNIPVVEASLTDSAVLQLARDQLDQQYDRAEGGFGNAPKFPMPGTLQRVLRHWAYARRQGGRDKDALDMVMVTLTQMARGGIYDHIGGGFCRYATDKRWMIPHFEKMLYDNAQLLTLYSDALALGPDELFEGAIRETVAWLLREMRSEHGGFYAAVDAESEGEEGKFYVWRREHVKRALNDDEYLLVETLYGLDKPANFNNSWNLHRHDSWRSVVQRLSLDRPVAQATLASAKAKLFALREQRPKPAIDRKILLAWNGLLIDGLAAAGQRLVEPEWLGHAQGIVDFAYAHCWSDGQLAATFQDGSAKHAGYLDDYANLLFGITSLLQARWRDQDVQFAIHLADGLLTHFYDADNGGFYFTSHAHEQLIHRPKPTMDDALPPGNGTAVQGLLRLGHLLGETRYLDAAHNTLNWARALLEKVPAGHCSMLHALEQVTYPPQTIILRGPEALADEWRAALQQGYTPWRTVYHIPYDDVHVTPEYLPRLVALEQQTVITAYVCSGLQCSLPITELDDLQAALS